MRQLKAGELANRVAIAVTTIRYYTDIGLLPVAGKTAGGYNLYDESALQVIKKIKQLKKKRYTLGEIKEKVGDLKNA